MRAFLRLWPFLRPYKLSAAMALLLLLGMVGSDLVAVFGDGSSSIDLSAGVGSVIVRPEAE